MKWILAILGWTVTGSFMGAVAGYFIGMLAERAFSGINNDADDYSAGNSRTSTGRATGYGTTSSRNPRDSFFFSLLFLSAHVIQADGKIMHSEMELVRNFLRNNFGESAVSQGNDMLLRIFEQRKQLSTEQWNSFIESACMKVRNSLSAEMRLQLLAYLCEIAKADGKIENSEVDVLHSIAAYLGLDAGNVEQMLHLGGESIDDDYAVLGVSKDATDEEVRRAYRKMALQYHPDRVATLGEDVKAAAQKKFQEINNAKERIYKARGMK